MIKIRHLQPNDLAQTAEIDVSEEGTQTYKLIDGQLQIIEEEWQRPRWDADKWQSNLERWARTLKSDGYLGAFDGQQMVGFAGLRYQLTPTMAELTLLWINRAHRHQGVASKLVQEVFRMCKAAGAETIYVSSTPTIPAVSFYMSQGFRPTSEPDPYLFELEPLDIHMTCPL
ncbi:MAG: GNAT family N-acetyltransferase [Chloroflexota bacterium]